MGDDFNEDKLKLEKAVKDLAIEYSKNVGIVKGDWWIKDFLSRKPESLDQYSDPSTKKWAEQLRRYQERLKEFTAPKIDSIENLKKTLEVLKKRPIEQRLRRLTWYYAERTDIVPKYERGWLAQLLSDPFKFLRPLKDDKLAKQLLERTALFDSKDYSTEAEHISCALDSAEQYLNTVDNVSISVSPLIMYYAAVAVIRACLVPRVKELMSGGYRTHGLILKNIFYNCILTYRRNSKILACNRLISQRIYCCRANTIARGVADGTSPRKKTQTSLRVAIGT